MINWNVSAEDMPIIEAIASRAYKRFDCYTERLEPIMDITACHLNDTRLRLAELLKADDFNFAHDILGIRRHINRKTGKLEDCFVPRFAQRS